MSSKIREKVKGKKTLIMGIILGALLTICGLGVNSLPYFHSGHQVQVVEGDINRVDFNEEVRVPISFENSTHINAINVELFIQHDPDTTYDFTNITNLSTLVNVRVEIISGRGTISNKWNVILQLLWAPETKELWSEIVDQGRLVKLEVRDMSNPLSECQAFLYAQNLKHYHDDYDDEDETNPREIKNDWIVKLPLWTLIVLGAFMAALLLFAGGCVFYWKKCNALKLGAPITENVDSVLEKASTALLLDHLPITQL